MSDDNTPDLRAVIIAEGAKRNVALDRNDIREIDGELTIDGMDWAEWLDNFTDQPVTDEERGMNVLAIDETPYPAWMTVAPDGSNPERDLF